MIQNPFFTIIIPVFNTEKLLPRCIESVLNQSFNNFEIIIINDCSPGNCVELINGYNDSRIKLIDKKQNEGTHMARKSGVELANSEYCLFLDSDDTFELNALEELYNHLNINPVDLLEFGFKDPSGKSKSNFNYLENKVCMLDRIINYNEKFQNHTIWTKAVKTEIVKKAFNKMKDFYCLWFEDGYEYFIITTQCKTFDAIEKYLYIYDMGGITTTSKIELSYDKFSLRVKNIADIINALNTFLEDENLVRYKPIVNKIYENQVNFLLNMYFSSVKRDDKVRSLQLALELFDEGIMTAYLDELFSRPSTNSKFYKIFMILKRVKKILKRG